MYYSTNEYTFGSPAFYKTFSRSTLLLRFIFRNRTVAFRPSITRGFPERIRSRVDDTYVARLAKAVSGELGEQVGVAPRVFLKKLVGDVLDRVDQFPDFDPTKDYRLTMVDSELTEVERNARRATSVDEIDLDLD